MADVVDAVTAKGWISLSAARIVKIAGGPVLVLAVLVWVVVAVFRSGGPSQPRLYAEFVDQSDGSYLDVQLDHSAASYGAFSVSFPGAGRVWPADHVDVMSNSADAVRLHYDGTGYQDPVAHADDESGGEPSRDRRPRSFPLRLVGQVDPVHHVASVDVWVNGKHEQIGSTGQPSGPDAVATAFLSALSTRDWNQVYDLEDPYMRTGTPRTEFVAAMTSAGASRSISDAEAIGPMRRSTTQAGVSYARVPIRMTYRTGTVTSTERTTLVLAVNRGAWRAVRLE